MDEPMFHVSGIRMVKMLNIFIFLTLFGELNLIMVTLANFGVILWAKECMHEAQLTQKW